MLTPEQRLDAIEQHINNRAHVSLRLIEAERRIKQLEQHITRLQKRADDAERAAARTAEQIRGEMVNVAKAAKARIDELRKTS